MTEEINWKEKWAEFDRYHEDRLEKLASKGGIDREYFGAMLSALRSCKESDLFPIRNEDGEFIYRPEQGVKAACHGREDAAATLIIQRSILERLQILQWAAWLCIAILIYIAYRVS
jgi:hypothetical protein